MLQWSFINLMNIVKFWLMFIHSFTDLYYLFQQVFSTGPPDITHQPPPPMNQTLPPNGIDNIPFSQPPPGYFPPPGMFPDFSKPPPGFMQKQEPVLEELLPTAPYYDLPAGLMVPLVKVCSLTCF